tara:strand:+ start:55 stop:291 length:237 start_codon:yes stop_codon:yes gene_type:complete
MEKKDIDKLYEETQIYAWHTTDQKQDLPDMSVDFVFSPFTDVEEAIEKINEALENSDLNYQMRVWTMPHQDNYENISE